MWGRGTRSRPRACSTHKTLMAAIAAALKCERAGGMPHDIFEVTKMRRPSKEKRRRRASSRSEVDR